MGRFVEKDGEFGSVWVRGCGSAGVRETWRIREAGKNPGGTFASIGYQPRRGAASFPR
jgi:hypothetical protein